MGPRLLNPRNVSLMTWVPAYRILEKCCLGDEFQVTGCYKGAVEGMCLLCVLADIIIASSLPGSVSVNLGTLETE